MPGSSSELRHRAGVQGGQRTGNSVANMIHYACRAGQKLTASLGPIGQLIGRWCLDPEIILKLQEDGLISGVAAQGGMKRGLI